MSLSKINIGKLFLATALAMLILGLLLGVLASQTYIFANFMKVHNGLALLRPMHVSSVMIWILLGATGCIYSSLSSITNITTTKNIAIVQWIFWIVAIIGIFYSYLNRNFGGREYWEFNPVWSLPIAVAWLLFIYNFLKIVLKIKNWPVYFWMWLTGICFFMFTFIENYLWVLPYFRENFITDTTIQWKVNGSLVGSWNQILYGTAFYLMDRIKKSESTGRSRLAFAMYFLGLFNLMFNWGHHIYILPTEPYIRYIGYAVSMTEWVFFIKIIHDWRKSVPHSISKKKYFTYKYLMAADFWVFLNLGQALMMSIPAFNLYTHGTHVTVAHAMGTTIGINTMILLAACFEFSGWQSKISSKTQRILKASFWSIQVMLFVFWLSLNIAGIQKGIWQMSEHQTTFNVMMRSIKPLLTVFAISGFGLAIAVLMTVSLLFIKMISVKMDKTKILEI